jgi:hypothetical protein
VPFFMLHDRVSSERHFATRRTECEAFETTHQTIGNDKTLPFVCVRRSSQLPSALDGHEIGAQAGKSLEELVIPTRVILPEA